MFFPVFKAGFSATKKPAGEMCIRDRGEADAEGNGANGMHYRELAGNQGVEPALDAKLALVIGGEVTKSRN